MRHIKSLHVACTCTLEQILVNYGAPKHAITQPLPILYDQLNNDPRFLFEDSDDGRRQIIEKYTEIQVNALSEMGSYFSQLPKAEVIVKRIPEYAEASGSSIKPSK